MRSFMIRPSYRKKYSSRYETDNILSYSIPPPAHSSKAFGPVWQTDQTGGNSCRLQRFQRRVWRSGGVNHKAHEPGLIRNDVFLQIFLHSLHVGGNPRTVDNDNLISRNTIEGDLSRPKFRRWMKLDLVESPCGLVAEIDITVRRPPLRRYVVFQPTKKIEQTSFRHEVLVGLVR